MTRLDGMKDMIGGWGQAVTLALDYRAEVMV
jgi:hypothetical protein